MTIMGSEVTQVLVDKLMAESTLPRMFEVRGELMGAQMIRFSNPGVEYADCSTIGSSVTERVILGVSE